MKDWFYTCSIILCFFTGCSRQALVLENDCLRAEFDSKNGSLTGFLSKKTDWKIIERAVLGQSFEMLVPLTDIDIRYHVIKGIEQKNPVIEEQADKITFIWSGLKSELLKERADITFKGTVRLMEAGLEYSGEIVNNSNYVIEYVSWPILGEVSVPDKNATLYHTTRSDSRELFPCFLNQQGYWGVDYPTSLYHLPEHSFVQVNNSDQGFILYNTIGTFPNFIITSCELLPGYELKNTNPISDGIDGEPVRIQFKTNQVLYTQPGDKAILNPVQLDVYKGSMYAGIDIYRKTRQNSVFRSPDWIQQPLIWQKIAAGSGEELIRHARECAALGVNALQVRGWYRTVDGRIEEKPGLAKAIKECRDMGVRVVLETNWTQADKNSDYFRENLSGYLMTDPFGIAYDRSYLCPLSGYIQKYMVKNWSKPEALYEADGVINTDNNHRGKAYFCFSADHDHPPGEPTVHGTMTLDDLMAHQIRASGPEKVVLGFGFLDQQHAIYDAYQLTVPPQHITKHRYLNNDIPVLMTVDVKSARKDMNMALMNRLTMCYDLQFHNTNLKDYPHIISYGWQIKSFVEKYRQYIWDAVFIPHEENLIEGDHFEYSVFRSKHNGKKAIVVINTDTENPSKVRLKNEETTGFFYASPEHPQAQPYREVIEIQPQSVIVFFEKDLSK